MSTPRKLTRAEKKQIEAAIARAKRQDKKKLSAQDSIPFQRMFPDGICRVKDNYYTKTIQFQDINYQLNQNEDKTAIFEAWCDFLNYFDSSIRFQLSFLNLSAAQDSFSKSVSIPLRPDGFDDLRNEYSAMLQNQLAKGNNGLIKTKYLTFGVEAETLRAAKPRLERVETDILNNFKRLGVVAQTLNGMERLRLLHGMFHMDTQEPFRFSWDWLAPSGLSVKDFIAPSSFEFAKGNSFGMGRKVGAVSFLQILAPELNDRMLADFLDMESSLIVNMHVQSVDQVSAIKTIKRKITDLDKMKIEEQKKAVRSGYDMDIIPSDLATYGGEAKKLLQDLQSRNERMFLVTFLVLNTADTKQQLDNNVFQASSIAQKYNCQLTRLDFRQEEGLMSSLPLGLNQVEIQRGLTTSSTAIFVPFTTQELFQSGKEALYCGLNALSNNLIMVDRKLLKNPNGLILGTPGSGKSFAAKREMMSTLGSLYPEMVYFSKAAENIASVQQEKPLPYQKDASGLMGYGISFEDVSFFYEDDVEVLCDISFDAKPGTVTALVGPSGSGKTTIISLISRFWDVQRGQIRIGGTDVKEISPDGLASCIAVVFQDVYLLNDTIANNIRIGRPSASMQEVEQAARAAQCHDFISALPDGYDTVVGEGGSTLSGGEKQRISIARALIKDAPIVLLDETTSSLDADNEREINRALDTLMANKTVVVIAHRLNTIVSADQIIVLDKGQIKEQGTHKELLSMNGWYSHVIAEQERAKKWTVIAPESGREEKT
uniref:VirB4-like conjugal transfer ATPase, CD1110 family n=1 Tax=Enterocloster clostridioformis TaxID=1531 RepID=UPI003522CB23